jgi:hypothetical protein
MPPIFTRYLNFLNFWYFGLITDFDPLGKGHRTFFRHATSGSGGTDILMTNLSHTSAALSPGISKGSLFGLETFLDGCGKPHPYRDSNTKLFSHYLQM